MNGISLEDDEVFRTEELQYGVGTFRHMGDALFVVM